MNKIFLGTLLTGMFWSCNQTSETDQPAFSLIGTIKYPETGLVLLEEYQNQQVVAIDTLEIQPEGTFDHQLGNMRPGYYRLNFYNKQMVNLILTGVDLNIEVDGNAPRGLAKVTGSPDMDKLTEVNELVQTFQQEVGLLNQQFAQANAQQDQGLMESLRTQFVQNNTVHKNKVKNKIRAMGNSLAVLQVVGNLDAQEDFQLLDSLGNLFAKNPPDEVHTKDFLAYIDQIRAQNQGMELVEVGKIAPEISLPDPDGNVVSLSSLRGKIVLVDFWAQWCKPCRMENPNIVAAYQKYKDKGFDVFGVSLDRTKEQWVRGIEEDGLAWTHVSDLQYWQSAAAQTYGVRAIPASFLLDKDGIIIAKNLRGPALQAKLKEILG